LPWPLIQAYVGYSVLFGNGIPAAQVQPLGGRVFVAGVWLALSFAPSFFWGVVYYRRAQHRSLMSALLMSHALVLWSYVSYLAAYRALGRILVRRNAWTKTSREREDVVPPTPALLESAPH
jgi:hypothetical protein